MIPYSPITCFMPRNGSCNFKLGPGQGGKAGEILSAICVHTQILLRSLSVLSQQREGEFNSLLLASFFSVSWGKGFFPGLHLMELFSFALVQTPEHHWELHAAGWQGGPGMPHPGSGEAKQDSKIYHLCPQWEDSNINSVLFGFFSPVLCMHSTC